jgi:hypothetical protein
MKTHLKVYKTNSKYNNIYLALCVAISIVGISGIVMMLFREEPIVSFLNEANYILLLFHGVLGMWFIWKNNINRKYFVAWNDHEISYLLPKSKITETIKIKDIKSLNKTIGKVDIELINGETKRFSLNSFFFPERRKINDFFEEINSHLTKASSS